MNMSFIKIECASRKSVEYSLLQCKFSGDFPFFLNHSFDAISVHLYSLYSANASFCNFCVMRKISMFSKRVSNKYLIIVIDDLSIPC